MRKVEEILRERMKMKKISQYKLRDMTGVSRTYIGDILSRESSHGSKEALEKIIAALDFNQEERIEIWISWLSEKGLNEIVEHYKKIEEKYLNSLKK